MTTLGFIWHHTYHILMKFTAECLTSVRAGRFCSHWLAGES